MLKCAVILFSVLTIPVLAYADTIIVPDDYPTIQGAIDASVNGDTVLVKRGTYVENIDFLGKAIVVRSEKGAGDTVIDGGQAGSVAAFDDGEGLDSVLEGFTLTNGTGTPVEVDPGKWKTYGGGVCCLDFSSPTVSGNIITLNEAYYGGGISARHGCSPDISGNTISQNEIYSSGGGIYISWDSCPSIQANTITGNDHTGIRCQGDSAPSISGNSISHHAYGIQLRSGSNAVVDGNSISESTYTGISCDDCIPLIKNNTITGGGLYCIVCWFGAKPSITDNFITGAATGIWCSNNCSLKIFNNIIADNKSHGIYCDMQSSAKITNNTISGNGTYGIWTSTCWVDVVNTIVWGHNKEIYWDISPAPTVSYSDVQGGITGTGNIDADPLFVDPAGNDFHISYLSPCRGAGANGVATKPYDFEGDPRIAYGTVDMGADEFYTHLYVTGDKTPGGAIEGKFISLPGTTPVGLFVGSGVLPAPLPTMWGEYWLQAPYVLLGPLGAIPSDGVMVLPTTLPLGMTAPIDIPMQALIGLNADSLTNLCVLEVR